MTPNHYILSVLSTGERGRKKDGKGGAEVDGGRQRERVRDIEGLREGGREGGGEWGGQRLRSDYALDTVDVLLIHSGTCIAIDTVDIFLSPNNMKETHSLA